MDSHRRDHDLCGRGRHFGLRRAVHILNPRPIENPLWNYVVLALAVVFESFSFYIAFKAFQAAKGEQFFWRAIHTTKDPTTFTVLFEDSAALLGLVVALVGVYLAHEFDNPYFDGSASIVIGVILAAVAVLLAYETKGLLIGEGADPETLREIRRLAESDAAVERVNRALTMYFGPHTVLLAMDLQFRKDLSAATLEQTVDRLEETIRRRYPDVKHIFIESDSLPSSYRQNTADRDDQPSI